jgi:hypothetical protein
VQLGGVVDQMTSVTCGRMLPASSGKSNPDGFSLKTLPGTSAWALKLCCESYGTWASRLRLAHSRRLKLARRTNGFGGSAWPTAIVTSQAQTAENPTPRQTGGTTLAGAAERLWPTPRSSESENRATRSSPSHGNGHGFLLAGLAGDVVGRWTTPQAHDATPRGKGQVPSAKAGNACLATDAMKWSTLKSTDGAKGGPGQSYGTGETPPLPAQAVQWPTPASRDYRGENGAEHLTNGTGRLHLDQLPNAVAFLFSRPLWASMIASHGRAVSRRILKGRARRRLNPLFVGWLMGWPIGHALCACSAMEFTLWQQHMRGALSQLPMASGPWIWAPPDDSPEPMQIDMFGGTT